jgi:hypothetical protein
MGLCKFHLNTEEFLWKYVKNNKITKCLQGWRLQVFILPLSSIGTPQAWNFPYIFQGSWHNTTFLSSLSDMFTFPRFEFIRIRFNNRLQFASSDIHVANRGWEGARGWKDVGPGLKNVSTNDSIVVFIPPHKNRSKNRDSSVGIDTRLRAGWSGF